MHKWFSRLLILAIIALMLPSLSHARGTRYFVDWPEGHIGPVYVMVYDIRCNPPFQVLDRFKVWVTWGHNTKCYEIGNQGSYVLKFYKDEYCKGPMIISANASSFRIRYGIAPPWI